MEKANLKVIPTIQEAIQIGLKNLPSLIGAAALYILTIWIPYINVGTTIAMQSIPGKSSPQERLSHHCSSSTRSTVTTSVPTSCYRVLYAW